ncbi:hypothetical protein J3L16_06795 [Alteromonas sp. 5E99-2]|uniref:hypothetical protein n=1 Tax=Alteromonas sp. 5E99-2 TaxID=2817683 RepID=UPI001A985F48|nr:hypothetical protein [Alteromonas sp. 5E99-2]MBO1255389.1 hypothetical protein [Alteromonas sp. 5E99-2]
MDTKRAFNQLAYQLIYPAVLGSIIFDLADPFRVMSEVRLTGFLIGLCFVVDYLHMTLNLCKDGSSPYKYGAAIDIVIAFLFCLSYFSLSRTTVPEFDDNLLKTYFAYSLGYIFFAQLLILLYEAPLKTILKLNISYYIPILISASGLIGLTFSNKENSIHILFASLFLTLATYSYRVFISSREHNRKESS